jgi:hypothetical protein
MQLAFEYFSLDKTAIGPRYMFGRPKSVNRLIPFSGTQQQVVTFGSQNSTDGDALIDDPQARSQHSSFQSAAGMARH